MPEHWVDRLWFESIKEEIAFEKERGYLTYHVPEKGSVALGAHVHLIIILSDRLNGSRHACSTQARAVGLVQGLFFSGHPCL
jgi:hypothetical protein